MLIFGIVLFALGIAVTIALHEFGHFQIARWSGMRVRRFFVGFGPTLWSVRRGHTVYGFKAIPLGGFCDIAGMTGLDEMSAEERPHAMYDKPAWKRIAVLLGGPAMNFLLGFILLYGVALQWGLPNADRELVPASEVPVVVAQTGCVSGTQCRDGGPAAQAGIASGDTIVQVDGERIDNLEELTEAVQSKAGQSVPVTVLRDGSTVNTVVNLRSSEVDGQSKVQMGVQLDLSAIPESTFADPRYRAFDPFTPVSAVAGTVSYSGYILDKTVEGIIDFPSKMPAVVQSIFGAPRSDDSPVSVVGASHIGGQAVEQGIWVAFWLLLASLNFFIAAFNLIPLPPLDGGHIAVVLYEKLRDAIRKLRGIAPGGPADYTKIAPVTMSVFSVLIVISFIIITADFVNPIRF